MDSTMRASRRDPSTDLPSVVKRLRQAERLDDFEPEAFEAMGETFEPHDISEHSDGVHFVQCGHSDWYIARDAEAAGALVGSRWAEMVEHDPSEIRALLGDDVLCAWAMGQPAGPGNTQVRSLTEWIDVMASVPHEELASYDGEEQEITRAGSELVEKLGYVPTVGYLVNY